MKRLITILTILILIGGTAFAGYLADPMRIGVGARSLGMGKAYVALAEDGDTIFMNPAGLGRIASPKLTSMYASLLNDINYTVIGGVYPYSDRSALGIGFVSSSTEDITLRDAEAAYIGSGRWRNSLLFVSYGTYLNRIPLIGETVEKVFPTKDILVGGTLKYFSIGGTGPGLEDSSGSGTDVDVAMLIPATENLMLGVNAQNILPASMGGKMSGSSDDIPASLKVGAKLDLGKHLYGVADFDYENQGKTTVAHYGVEYWPIPNLALRVGSDDGELTGGIGLRFAGIEFNYAYHPYSGIAENTTHFFSLGYLGESVGRELKVEIETPADKTIIYEDHVKIAGRVVGVEGPVTLKINGVNVPVALDLTFDVDIPIEGYGKKLVVVEATGPEGQSFSQDLRLLRLTSFADVPDGYWAKQPIENTGTVGLIQGYPDGTFKPERKLTRAELATLMVRAKGIKAKGRAKKVFKDVSPNHWAARYIEEAQWIGLIEGYPDKTFRPNNKIRMSEAIAILTRFDKLLFVDKVTEKPFADVPVNHWAAKYIEAAKRAGMLSYIKSAKLGIADQITRSEIVEMLSKTSLAKVLIKELHDWEKGFKPEYAPMRPRIRASLF